MRVAPGGDAHAHLDALRVHLERYAPWGNESLHLGVLERAAIAEALLLANLA